MTVVIGAFWSSGWMGPDLNWGGRARTFNLLVNSQALCQLSYTPSPARPEELLQDTAVPGLPSLRFEVSYSASK
jgi:hypothetical protein